MDNKTYYEARWKVWMTKHIKKLDEMYGKKILWSQVNDMDKKTYYKAKWKVWITKHIMKPRERYG